MVCASATAGANGPPNEPAALATGDCFGPVPGPAADPLVLMNCARRSERAIPAGSRSESHHGEGCEASQHHDEPATKRGRCGHETLHRIERPEVPQGDALPSLATLHPARKEGRT